MTYTIDDIRDEMIEDVRRHILVGMEIVSTHYVRTGTPYSLYSKYSKTVRSRSGVEWRN